MIDQPAVATISPRPAAVIRMTIPKETLDENLGPAVGELIATLTAQGLGPAGPLYCLHHRTSPEVYDFEVGFPAEGEVQPAGRVTAGQIPGWTVAHTTVTGPRTELPKAWARFASWVREEGLRAHDEQLEIFLKGPETGADPSEFVTQLCQHIDA